MKTEQLNENTPVQLTENGQSQHIVVKKKHKSALVAASKARSAVEHVDAHKLSSLTRDFSLMGTNFSYESI